MNRILDTGSNEYLERTLVFRFVRNTLGSLLLQAPDGSIQSYLPKCKLPISIVGCCVEQIPVCL